MKVLLIVAALWLVMLQIGFLAASTNTCVDYAFPVVKDRTGIDYDGKTKVQCYKGKIVGVIK